MTQKVAQSGERRERKRSREIQKRTGCTSMRVFMSPLLCIWFIPQRVLLFFVRAGTQRQHLCISAHPALPRESSRHCRSICLSASARTQTRTNQILLSLWCILVLARHYGNLSQQTWEGLNFHTSVFRKNVLEGSLEVWKHPYMMFTVVYYM